MPMVSPGSPLSMFLVACMGDFAGDWSLESVRQHWFVLALSFYSIRGKLIARNESYLKFDGNRMCAVIFSK